MDDQLIHDFIDQLARISHKFNELEKIPVDLGTGELLYPSEIHVIEVIGEKADITITEISVRFGITKGAVSQVINKLNQKGYIQKVRREENGKEIDLFLTAKGYQAFGAHQKLHQSMDEEIVKLMGSFPDEWLGHFHNIFIQIERHVDKYIAFIKKK
jgi:DNA-binding MarR family transcriptional regulator